MQCRIGLIACRRQVHRSFDGACGRRGLGSIDGGALLLTHAQWQGEGGINAAGLVHGAELASRVLSELLPACVAKRTVQLEATPLPKPWKVPAMPPAPSVCFHGDLIKQTAAVFEQLDESSPELLFTAGGDSSVDLASCSWLQARYNGDVAVLYIGAHADLQDPSESASAHFHGMCLRALLGDAPKGLFPRVALRPSAVVHAGLRTLDASEARVLERLQILSMPTELLNSAEGSVALRRALCATGCSKLHVHLSLDVLDPDVFRHTSAFYKGCSGRVGLRAEELQSMLSAATLDLSLVGLTICELRPRHCCEKKNDARSPCCSKARKWHEKDEHECMGVLRAALGPNGLDVAARVRDAAANDSL